MTKVEQALKALISPDELTAEEMEDYLDGMDELLSKPSAAEDAFFADRRQRGVGVGMDEAGSIVRQSPQGA